MQIPFHKAHIGEEEISEVTNTIRSGWLTMGTKTIEFENAFAAYLSTPYAISVNSCTAALHLALKAIGLKPGDEVIIPTNTFIATAEVITYFQAIPVLADIETKSHCIDPSKIEALITPKTKAIIPVHFAGIPADMDAITQIAKKHKLKVIEDAAHALPAKYHNQLIGTISDMTCFSFYATKTLCTGEGGMVTTQNPEYVQNIKINRLHGMNRDAWKRYTAAGSWYYEIVDNGCKYNMTDINASLGLIQLKKVDWMHQERQKIAAKYTAAFQNKNIDLLTIPPNTDPAWHLYVIKLQNRDEFIEKMKDAGIICSVHFIPVHMMPYYQKTYSYNQSDYPVSNQIFSKIVSLPIFPGLTDDQINYIITKTIEYAK